MDYEVSNLTRIREEYDATGSTDTAIVLGIGRTGRMVTSAALILCLVTDLDLAPRGDSRLGGVGSNALSRLKGTHAMSTVLHAPGGPGPLAGVPAGLPERGPCRG